jgi:hypothetical protein
MRIFSYFLEHKNPISDDQRVINGNNSFLADTKPPAVHSGEREIKMTL